jgi:carbonic anhydrase
LRGVWAGLYKIPNQLTSHTAKALVITCMDFRLIDDEVYFLNKLGYINNYDQFILAGASLGYNQTTFPAWSETLEKHIELSQELHNINEIIVIDHMNCGAYKKFYNFDYLSQEKELELHKKNFDKFRESINTKFPKLKVTTLLMDLNGYVIKI